MTLNPNRPSDSKNFVSDLAVHQRETREYINSLLEQIATLGSVASYSEVEMSNGQTDLVAGEDVSNVSLEIVYLTTAAGEENLENITTSHKGQTKILVFNTDDITVIHNVSKIKLDGGADVKFDEGDMLVLVYNNVSEMWTELHRQFMVS